MFLGLFKQIAAVAIVLIALVLCPIFIYLIVVM